MKKNTKSISDPALKRSSSQKNVDRFPPTHTANNTPRSEKLPRKFNRLTDNNNNNNSTISSDNNLHNIGKLICIFDVDYIIYIW